MITTLILYELAGGGVRARCLLDARLYGCADEFESSRCQLVMDSGVLGKGSRRRETQRGRVSKRSLRAGHQGLKGLSATAEPPEPGLPHPFSLAISVSMAIPIELLSDLYHLRGSEAETMNK